MRAPQPPRVDRSLALACTLALVAAFAACRSPAPMLAVVPTPPATLPPLAQIVRACAFEVSCLHNPPASTMTACDTYFEAGLDNWIFPQPTLRLGIDPGEFRRYVACANAATDCAGVLACASRGHDAAYCAAHPDFACDGDLLVQCPSAGAPLDPAIYTSDCAALGMHCVATALGTAVCTDGVACTDPPGQRCDGNRYLTSCDAATHLRYRMDCSRSSIPNATCRYLGPEGACLPSGPPCAGDRCEGDVLVTCLAGEEVRSDCTQHDATCSVVNRAPTCVPVNSECDASMADACSGAGITTCFEGELHTIFCDDIGASTCMPAPGGTAPICVG
jgi:hypothetical protein